MSEHLVIPCALVWAVVGTSAASTLWAAVRAERPRAWLGVGLAALCVIVGNGGSVGAVRRTFEVVALVDPAQKATLLSAGIAEALGPAQVGWFGAAVVLVLALVGLWRTR